MATALSDDVEFTARLRADSIRILSRQIASIGELLKKAGERPQLENLQILGDQVWGLADEILDAVDEELPWQPGGSPAELATHQRNSGEPAEQVAHLAEKRQAVENDSGELDERLDVNLLLCKLNHCINITLYATSFGIRMQSMSSEDERNFYPVYIDGLQRYLNQRGWRAGNQLLQIHEDLEKLLGVKCCYPDLTSAQRKAINDLV